MEFGPGESWLPEILVTVAVERVVALYVMQDVIREEMTIYMNTCIVHKFYSVTCQLHGDDMFKSP